MFAPGNAVRVYLATGTTDMRKSINGLSILVADQLELDPFSGYLFCFCNRKKDIVKILYWHGNGFCLWQKRLERHRFQWPQNEQEVITMQGRELSWLLDGLSPHQAEAHALLTYETVV